MPKGVEHIPSARLEKANYDVPNSVMPKGVEHVGGYMGVGRHGDSAEFSDAERR